MQIVISCSYGSCKTIARQRRLESWQDNRSISAGMYRKIKRYPIAWNRIEISAA